jgi:hypothetical protein
MKIKLDITVNKYFDDKKETTVNKQFWKADKHKYHRPKYTQYS